MRVLSVECTNTYRKCLEGITNAEIVDKAIRSWGLSFTFTTTTRSEKIYWTPQNKVEVWEVRFGNPDQQTGASGGFRVILFYVRDEEVMFLDYISERSALNKPKVKQSYAANLKELKDYLKRTYDSGKS